MRNRCGKGNGQLVLMQGNSLSACAWEQQWKVGCLCFFCSCFPRYTPSSCSLSPLSDHWLIHLKTASQRVEPITPVNWAVKQWEKWKEMSSNSTFQPGSSWSRPARRSLGKLWRECQRKELVLFWTCVSLQPWSVRGMWKAWCCSLGGPPHLSCVTCLVKET